jgi:alkylhydroperoxidase family enzyme
MHGGSAEALSAVQQGDLDSPSLSVAEKGLLSFAGKVNSRSHEISAEDISKLRSIGWSEAQIAEAIHIAALFATYNRVANGFGLASQGLLELYENQNTEKNQ